MTPEQVKQLLPIITAFAEGKEIEVLIDDRWYKLTDPVFGGKCNEYRIKPDKKTAHVVVWKDKRDGVLHSSISYDNLEDQFIRSSKSFVCLKTFEFEYEDE